MKRNSGSIMVVTLIVVIVVMALARAWQPTAAGSVPPSRTDGPLPRVEPTAVAGPLAALSVLLYVPGPEVFLPLVLKQ